MIDWARVSELKDEFGEDEFQELLGVFLDEVRDDLAKLARARADGLEAHFHALKGSALNMGMVDLAQVCQQGETCARHGGLTDEVDRVPVIFAASQKALLDGLAQGAD